MWGDDGDETDTLVLRSTELDLDGTWTIEDPAYRRLSRAERQKALVRTGDLVVTKSSGSQEHLGKTGVVTPDLEARKCAYSNFMQRLRVSGQAEAKYVFWLINSRISREALNYFGSTTTGLRNLTGTILGDLPFPGPPVSEQRAIADFLDRKTVAIDALIEKKQRLARTLEEERQAVIAKAVTQGLRASASLVGSGLPWLGQVPSHWKVVELRRIVRPGTSITYGIVQAGPHVEDGVPYIRTSDMAGDCLPRDGYGKTSHEIDSAYRRSRVAAGDVVVAIRATVGKALVVPPELAGANLTQGTAKVSPGPRVLSNYLWYALRSAPSVQRFEALAKGVTFREITLDMLRRFQIPLPPLVEQEEICHYLAGEDERLLACRGLVEQSCERFRDYRQALITAAVTGQLDVTKEAA